MSRNHDRELSEALFQKLETITAHADQTAVPFSVMSVGELRKMKKFRFQLLHRWLVAHFAPCRAADIAGGKGLLALLLQESGWETAVIDPIHQTLPDKYKDIGSNQRVKVAATTQVRHWNKPFAAAMGDSFDLLIGMHAHGCNIAIVEAAAAFGCGFVLFPCCVIDEPFYPPIGVDWLECVAEYAVGKGIAVTPFRLNFKGQNIGLYGAGQRLRRLG
ncbi:MAG: hypothetical protein KDE56_25970 [Anaerolineales bacterium]|nr:hypothetical protein [Anaerolineales bacterium]